jgi:hypothetical protein
MKIGLIATSIWGSIHLDLAREMAASGHDIEVYTEDNRAPSGMSFTRLDEDGLHFWVIHGFRRNPLTWLPDRLFKYWLGRRFFTTLVAIWRFIRANRDRDVFVVESRLAGLLRGHREPLRRLALGRSASTTPTTSKHPSDFPAVPSAVGARECSAGYCSAPTSCAPIPG